MRKLSIHILLAIALAACSSGNERIHESKTEEILLILNQALTEAIVQDGFSPPVASRIYAYTSIAANAVLASNADQKPLVGSLDGFETWQKPKGEFQVDRVLADVFTTVGKALVYRDHILDSAMLQIEPLLVPTDEETKTNSAKLSSEISAMILARANSDGYGATRTMPRYVIQKGEDKWEPTPPGYSEALEPHWPKIMPFTLDSAGQFFKAMSIEFSTDPNSTFYKEIVLEVMDSVSGITEDQRMIARFWDCNPFLTKKHGHLVYNVRQLTPGGHWMAIAHSVSRGEGHDALRTSEVLALTATAMADAFIVAWHAKYKTNFIRPETYINRYIDPEWKPILESPHFPEYTSAHSTVSAAAAYVLTQEIGESYSFVDSSEVPFGLPARAFNSFFEASDEASISRVLGGIHFRPAIEQGMVQGREIGAQLLERVKKAD